MAAVAAALTTSDWPCFRPRDTQTNALTLWSRAKWLTRNTRIGRALIADLLQKTHVTTGLLRRPRRAALRCKRYD